MKHASLEERSLSVVVPGSGHWTHLVSSPVWSAVGSLEAQVANESVVEHVEGVTGHKHLVSLEQKVFL
jgi:hypothetical protein